MPRRLSEMPRPVTLYVREGCHLCEAALAELRRLERELGFTTEVVDIESDEALHARYLFEIPVVSLAGVEVARAPIAGRPLREALTAALGAPPQER